MIDPRAWAMPEDRGPDSLESHVRKLMEDLGLWGFHVRNSIGSERGWPDWVILGPRGGLHRELKTQRGTLSADQRSVGSRLICAGFDWAVWRPQDLFSGVIAEQLAPSRPSTPTRRPLNSRFGGYTRHAGPGA